MRLEKTTVRQNIHYATRIEGIVICFLSQLTAF